MGISYTPLLLNYFIHSTNCVDLKNWQCNLCLTGHRTDALISGEWRIFIKYPFVLIKFTLYYCSVLHLKMMTCSLKYLWSKFVLEFRFKQFKNVYTKTLSHLELRKSQIIYEKALNTWHCLVCGSEDSLDVFLRRRGR